MCPAMCQEEGKRWSWSTALQSVPRKIHVESCDCFHVLHLTWVLGFPVLKYYLCVIHMMWRSCSSSNELLWLHVECFRSGMLLQYLLSRFWVSRRSCIANAMFRQAEESNGYERACQTGEAPSKSWQYCICDPSVSTDKLWEEQPGLIASPSFESWYHYLKTLASLPASVPASIKWGWK